MTLEQKVRNYQGSNNFLNSLKQSLTRYTSLTQRQAEIAERALLTIERNGELVIENLSEDLQLIMNYTGSNEFVMKIKEDYTKWRNLSDRQISAAVKTIKKEKTPTMEIRVDLNNESIKIKRGIALKIKEEYATRLPVCFWYAVVVMQRGSPPVAWRSKTPESYLAPL